MNTRGWTRLGIVLSLLWMAGIAVYAAANYYSTEEKLTQSSFDLSSATPVTESDMSQNSNPLRDQKEGPWRKYAHESDLPPGFEIIEQENFLIMCTGHAKSTSCMLKTKNFLLLLLGPVLAAWLSISILAAAFFWVRAGFRPK